MGRSLRGLTVVIPYREQLIQKKRLKCTHELVNKIQNGYNLRLKQVCLNYTQLNLKVSQILYQEGFLQSVSIGDTQGINYEQVTSSNIGSRRYWLNLKYYKNEPVLNNIYLVSKPSRKVFVNPENLENVLVGHQQGLLKPLLPGEIIILNTDKGVMEAHKALELNIGGQVLCRAF